MRSERTTAAIRLARAIGRALRDEGDSGHSLVDACATVQRLNACGGLLEVGLAVWRDRMSGTSRKALPPSFSSFEATLDATSEWNRNAFRLVADELRDARSDILVAGDGALLIGLYSTLAAFRSQLWVLGYDDKTSATSSFVGDELGRALPFELSTAAFGSVRELIPTHTISVQIEDRAWRIPTGRLMLVLLAARLGSTSAPPVPPVWFHLAVACSAWCRRMSSGSVLELAGRLGLRPTVDRGFAIARRVLPELREWMPDTSVQLPQWEQHLAIPLATRRVVLESL